MTQFSPYTSQVSDITKKKKKRIIILLKKKKKKKSSRDLVVVNQSICCMFTLAQRYCTDCLVLNIFPHQLLQRLSLIYSPSYRGHWRVMASAGDFELGPSSVSFPDIAYKRTHLFVNWNIGWNQLVKNNIVIDTNTQF